MAGGRDLDPAGKTAVVSGSFSVKLSSLSLKNRDVIKLKGGWWNTWFRVVLFQ